MNKGLWDVKTIQKCTTRNDANDEDAVLLENEDFDLDVAVVEPIERKI